MFYNAELCFLRESFAKCRLHTRLVTDKEIPQTAAEGELPYGEGAILFWLGRHLLSAENNFIYKISDSFDCSYMFLQLPETEEKTFLIIGPYFKAEQSSNAMLEKAETLGLDPKIASQLKNYYSEVPLINDTASIFAMLDAFADLIFKGAENFSVIDIDIEKTSSPSPLIALGVAEQETIEQNRKMMEQRYAYENELMQAVSLGLTHKAELLLSGFSQFSFQQRLADPVRNLKNYCIIMNTLLRKASESGGVHPLYLDSVSSSFAQKIEQLAETAEVESLMNEMFRTYCRLVRNHSMKDYSPPIARTIITIDSDLTADLSLSALARAQGVSSSYLSALFHKETGQTLTDFVNARRVKLAMQLLKTTSLQVQTIAQHCGILDIHYFSRIFKKYSGTTPKAYREGQ